MQGSLDPCNFHGRQLSKNYGRGEVYVYLVIVHFVKVFQTFSPSYSESLQDTTACRYLSTFNTGSSLMFTPEDGWL